MTLNDLLFYGAMGAAAFAAFTFKVEGYTRTEAFLEATPQRRSECVDAYFRLRGVWLSAAATSVFLLLFYDAPSVSGKIAVIVAMVLLLIMYRPFALRSGERTARFAYVDRVSRQLEEAGVPRDEARRQAKIQLDRKTAR